VSDCRWKRAYLAVTAMLAATALAAGAPAETAGEVVLSEKSFWRKHYTFIPPKLSIKAARAAGEATDPASRAKYIDRFYFLGFDTPPPPKEWTDAAFDDSAWQVMRGRQFTFGDSRVAASTPVDGTDVYLRGTDSFVEEVGLICQRGRFQVNDPAKVRKLTLSVACRGGFVAYLNGVEVARGSMPAGPVAYDTAADDYPLEAHFWRHTIGTDNPQYLGPFNQQWKPARDCDQWALRERTAGPIEIPTQSLRKGVNVLALELHRSDYPAEAKRKVTWKDPRSLGWATVGLSLMTLRAEADAGAVAALDPQRGRLQVWNQDIAWAVGERECPIVDAPPEPIRIVGAANGTFSGQVVVASDAVLAGVKAEVSPLKAAAGQAAIPASALKIRYGATNPTRWGMGLNYLTAVMPAGTDFGKGLGERFDMLLDAPPADVRSMPVWVTVQVPKDAAAGDYAGELTLRVAGHEPVKVPVQLYVAGWALPDVKDFVSVTNIYQSPDTLARYYKLKPWSPEHWAMIERSMKLMGEVGNIGLFFPLLSESQMGNPDSMVLWVKKDDGAFTYDFTIFDRYLETALKHHSRLRYLTLNVWGSEADAQRNNPTVTVVDPATGEKSQMRLPDYGTAECEAMWRPLLLEIRKRLTARGLDKLMVLGLADDRTPHWSHVAMFHRILPGVPWARESHFNRDSMRYDPQDAAKAVPVAYNSIVWGPAGGIPDPRESRYYGWRPKTAGHLVMNFNRPGTSTMPLLGFPQGWAYRQWMDSTLVLGRQGTGRVGGDYWDLGARFVGSGRVSSEASGGSRGTLFGIYLKSAVGQVGLGNSTTDLFGPGPNGPVTTIRFENAREGNQEAEVRIFLEKALLDRSRPLPADLAPRCQAVLDEATNVARLYNLDAGEIGWSLWQDRSRRLYDLAAEVKKVLKAKR